MDPTTLKRWNAPTFRTLRKRRNLFPFMRLASPALLNAATCYTVYSAPSGIFNRDKALIYKRLDQRSKMSINVQYVGFKSKPIVREYSFLVREAEIEPREVVFTILNEAFTSRRLSFQNAPDICSLKLHRELAAALTNPMKEHYRISDTELDDYNATHASKAAKGFYPRKPEQNF